MGNDADYGKGGPGDMIKRMRVHFFLTIRILIIPSQSSLHFCPSRIDEFSQSDLESSIYCILDYGTKCNDLLTSLQSQLIGFDSLSFLFYL